MQGGSLNRSSVPSLPAEDLANLDFMGAFLEAKIKEPLPIPEPATRNVDGPVLILNLEGPALLGLMQVKSGVDSVVKAESLMLRVAFHAAKLALQQKQSSVYEEKERQNFIMRKVVEKRATYEHAVAEYDRARRVLQGARADLTMAATTEQKSKRTMFIIRCETLCDSWAENMKIAEDRLGAWQLKSRLQIAAAAKATNELASAETDFNDAIANISERESHL